MPPPDDASAMGPAATRWPVVWVAFGAGIVAAAHIGKLPPALPDIRADLGAGLVLAGWMASMISTTGFALGLIAGAVADRLGQHRVMIFGLLALAAGSLLGARAGSAEMMLAARFIEGIGFTAVTITGGALIARATADADRSWALGVWAAYMPLGFAGMMMVGAVVLNSHGWRALWDISSAITVIWLVVVVRVIAAGPGGPAKPAKAGSIAANVRVGLAQGGALLAGAAFALYAAQHIAMMSWLPTYMRDVHGAGVLAAAAVPALVLGFNAAGNYLAAWAMARGAPVWLLLGLGAAGMAASEMALFSNALPDGLRLAAAFGFGLMGGLIPAAALAAAAVYAPSPALIGTIGGIMVMGSSTGQLFGPPALAAARQAAGGWDGTLWLLLSLAVAGMISALASRPMERRRSGF